MKNALNHKCKVCGTLYHACNDCDKESNGFLSWKSMCDTENHYKIYQIILWYCRGVIEEAEAREMLNKCDMSDKDTFTESILQLLDKIYYVKKSSEIETGEESKEESKNTYKVRDKKPAIKSKGKDE